MRPRTRTALAVVLVLAAMAATSVALPAAAGAKGIAALRVCGTNGCHPVDRAAVREGFERFSDAPTPDAAEPFFTIRAKARVSSGRLADVFEFDWLPRTGVTRPYGERLWTRPDPVLAAALRRAARGLTPQAAAALGSVYATAPAARATAPAARATAPAARAARVVEVYAPAGTAARSGGTQLPVPAGIIPPALAAAAVLLATAALLVRRRARP